MRFLFLNCLKISANQKPQPQTRSAVWARRYVPPWRISVKRIIYWIVGAAFDSAKPFDPELTAEGLVAGPPAIFECSNLPNKLNHLSIS
jgi:hypothetical protein